jgi:hypothetical protein
MKTSDRSNSKILPYQAIISVDNWHNVQFCSKINQASFVIVHVLSWMRHANCIIRHVNCNIEHVNCIIRHVNCIIRHVNFNIEHANCIIRHANCIIKHANCMIKHVKYIVNHLKFCQNLEFFKRLTTQIILIITSNKIVNNCIKLNY